MSRAAAAGEEAAGDGETEDLGGALADPPRAGAAIERGERVVFDDRAGAAVTALKIDKGARRIWRATTASATS